MIASAARHGCGVTIAAADWQPWASVTFTGARHRITLDAADTPALDSWLAALPEVELVLAGHLVADLEIVARDGQTGRVRARIEALTVEEC